MYDAVREQGVWVVDWDSAGHSIFSTLALPGQNSRQSLASPLMLSIIAA
jgi:hypothetical protein